VGTVGTDSEVVALAPAVLELETQGRQDILVEVVVVV
jgi:hypothetical protein